MCEIYSVKLSKTVIKDLKRIPTHIVIKLQAWIEDVGCRGLFETNKTPGYHAERLRGDRVGQFSIRLNKAYRAIYVIEKNNRVKFVKLIEVNKHEY
jgi:toxin HigB-1